MLTLQLIKSNMLLSVKMWSILAAIVGDKLGNLGLNVAIKIKLPAINVKMDTGTRYQKLWLFPPIVVNV